MPKTPSQFAKIRDERKTSVLLAALRLFALSGYDSISINDITKEVKCSHGLFYHYFATKTDLWKALISEASSRITPFFDANHFQNEIIKKSKAIEQLSFLSQHFVDLIYLNDGFFPYYFYMLINLKYQKTLPSLQEQHKFKPKHDPFLRLLELVKKGQAEKDISPGNPHDYVIFFFSALHGLASLVIHNDNAVKEKPNYQILMNIFRRKDETL